MERKWENKKTFYSNCASRRQTSAEIVTEARNSLKILGTRRPFTPQEEHRRLFGNVSSRDGRPPSTFRLKKMVLLGELWKQNLATNMYLTAHFKMFGFTI